MTLAAVLIEGAGRSQEIRAPGFRPLPPGVHALTGGRVFIQPGQVLDPCTVIIRDGLITDAGAAAAVPPDAQVWDMKGMTIYAGFIDPCLVLGGTNANVAVSTSDSEPVAVGATATSRSARFFGAPAVQTDAGAPGPGYEVSRITPDRRAWRDYSPKQSVLAPMRELGFAAAAIAPGRGIIRGTSALVALSDEDPNRAIIKPEVFQHISFETQQSDDRAYPGSLMGVIAAIRQALLDAGHYALEQAAWQNAGSGAKRPEFDPGLEALAPAAAGKARVLFEPGSALMVDRAARLASEFKLDSCIISSGQEWRRPDLARAARTAFIAPLNFPELPNLPEDSDWEQVTLDQLRASDWAPENPALLRKEGRPVALTTYGLADKKKFRPNLRLALDRGLSEEDALAALTTVPARLCGVEKQMGTIEPGKLACLTVVDGKGYFDPESKVRQVWIDGRVYQIPQGKSAAKSAATNSAAGTAAQNGQKDSAGKPAPASALRKTRAAHSPLAGRGPILQPAVVLIRNATVWTCGPEGRLENSDLLVVNGRIKAVGKGLVAPADSAGQPLVIDATGLHISPGIIDPHSHTAILGAVNESTLPSSAMVRISDVINSETSHLYEQLAGGVTAVCLFHGSANPIGGHSCVIKLRDGATPEELIFQAAPPGIKFALGENVKQSNWGERFVTRFPQTRMGVRTFIANRFTAAQQYLADWSKYRASGKPAGALPPRRNLELEALGEVIEGKRWIHCHAYRQDEILMFLRLMESFGVRVSSLEHALEGYKVADEMARHGVAGSTFSDWWAYKFEVYDAIPYNGSLMRDRGVLVMFNSDSSELARRLYLEAAKAVKYGGTPELEALQFVTLNPAKQLGVDRVAGSLEVGKDADFVLWTKSPLDSGTVCLQTWVDGKQYFDRAVDPRRTKALADERTALIEKARRLSKSGKSRDESQGKDADREAFFRVCLEHEFDSRISEGGIEQ